MTVRLSEIQLQKKAMVKMARTIIRTRHSNAADAELNEVLPALEKAFERSVQLGELPDPREVIREALGE